MYSAHANSLMLIILRITVERLRSSPTIISSSCGWGLGTTLCKHWLTGRDLSLPLHSEKMSLPDPLPDPLFLSNVQWTGTIVGKREEVVVSGVICIAKLVEPFFPRGNNCYQPIYASEGFVKECLVMSTLHHPNIVQLVGVCPSFDSRSFFLIKERMRTSLHDFLTLHRPPPRPGAVLALSSFSMPLKCSILHNVACGLAYLYERLLPCIHCDLSAKNIFLNSELVAKIDLELNSIAEENRFQNWISPRYSKRSVYHKSPEYFDFLYSNVAVNEELNVFSFGVVTIFTVGEVLPVLNPQLYMQNVNKQLSACGQLRDDHPLVHLIHQCLDYTPNICDVINLLEEARACFKEDKTKNKSDLIQALPKYQVSVWKSCAFGVFVQHVSYTV